MIYLKIEEVLYIYDRIMKATGGKKGVRNFDLLFSAIERPKANFGGKDLYPDIFSKAAALTHSLILNHPFIDGNKRTALVCLLRFLDINGISLKIKFKELEDLIMKIENKKTSLQDFKEWLQKNNNSK